MAKKKNIWDAVEKGAIDKNAKKAIEKTEPPKPQKKRGPKTNEDELTMIKIRMSDRKKFKTLASMMDETMIDAFSLIIQKEWNERMK